MILLHSEKIPDIYLKSLLRKINGVEFIKVLASDYVYKSIASHPDIFIFQANTKSAIVSKALSRITFDALKKHGIHLCESTNLLGNKYPLSSAFNAAKIGKYLIHNKKYTDKKIIEYADHSHKKIISVNQGYSRCSVIPVGDNAIITDDLGIIKSIKNYDISVLPVSKETIILPGEKNGFLGGTCGCMKETLIFLGDIRKHKDWPKILPFIRKQNKDVIFLEDLPLFDAGSLIFFDV